MVRATQTPNGEIAYHLDSTSEWSVDGVNGEVYITHVHRLKSLELKARLSGRAPPDPALVAAQLTEAFVKERGRRPVVRREQKRLARGEVVKGWPDQKCLQAYQRWADGVESVGNRSRTYYALKATGLTDTGSNRTRAAKVIRRGIHLRKVAGKPAIEWEARADAGKARKR